MTERVKLIQGRTIQSTRNWSNFQFIIAKGALLALMGSTLSAEVNSQQQGLPANINRYLLSGFLVFLLVILFWLEKWFNGWEDQRQETEGLLAKVGELQSAAIGYLFDVVLPNSTEDKVLEIIERFPAILGTITIAGVKKEVASGFQIMGDAMTTLSMHIDDIRRDIREEVQERLKPIESFFTQVMGSSEIPLPPDLAQDTAQKEE